MTGNITVGSENLGPDPWEAILRLRAERDRLREVLAEIEPEKLELLADWFDADDEFKITMFPETWPQRGHETQDDLRHWAKLLRGARP